MRKSFTLEFDESAEEGRRIGLFGSPHFVVHGEVYWGDDRLEDALAWAIQARKA